MSQVATPLEMFYRWERETPDQVFLRQPTALQWREYSWAQVGNRARRVATWLRESGHPPGSRIGLWSANSADWVVADLAIMLAGHVSVPLYPGQDAAAARYILEHSDTRIVFLGAFDQAAHADLAIPDGVTRVGLHGCKCRTDTDLETVIAQNAAFAESPVPDGEAIFTFVYTSGTTGNPKGVMHSHRTPGHVVPRLLKSFGLEQGRTAFFSFLPMAHVAERVLVELASLYANASVSFSEGLATFAEELRSVQPDFFFAVPRLWIKFKQGVDAKIPPDRQSGLTPEQRAALREQLGLSKARFIITGSAPCPRVVQQWFLDMGIWLRDGYGMTENFIDGCAWLGPGPPVPGCVGRSMNPDAHLRISPDGEIQFRSHGLMKGYFREPEKTAEVLVDGWYRTGDSGRIDADGNLWVTGRLGEVFKTSKGKFVNPIALESVFGGSPLLGQVCVFGHGLDQPVLLANLSEAARALDRDALVGRLAGLLDETNATLPAYSRVSQLFVTRGEWLTADGLLTATLKLRRKALEQRYRDWVLGSIGKDPVIFE